MYPIKQSTAITVPFFVHDVAGDAVTGLVDAGFTKRISKNGAAFGAMTVTITEMENGWYSFPLSTAHSDTLGLLTILFTHGSAKQVNLQFRVEVNLLDDLATAANLATVDTVVDGIQTDLDNGTDGLGAIKADTAAILVDTGTTLDARIPAALVGGKMDANVGAISADTVAADNAEAFFDGTGYAGTGNVIPTVTTLTGHAAQSGDSFARLGAPAGASVSADIASIETNTDELRQTSGSADSGTTNTMVDAARTEADTDYWVGSMILFTSGNIAGQIREITGFNPATDEITFTPPTTQAVATQGYRIVPGPGSVMRGTDSAALASVVGALADAAAAGDPTSADTMMQYLKQLVNVLVGTTGVTTWAASAAPANGVSISEALRAVYDDTNETVADTADMQPKIGTPAVDISADIAAVKAETALIVADTNELQTDDVPTLIAAVQADTDDIQTRLPAALVGGKMDADATAISGDTTAADRLEALMDGALICQVNDASALATAFAADGFTEATDDHFNGRLITFISGALSGQQTDITDYDAAGHAQGAQTFVVTALTEAPANNDFFVIH